MPDRLTKMVLVDGTTVRNFGRNGSASIIRFTALKTMLA